jgi:hypothetical protein
MDIPSCSKKMAAMKAVHAEVCKMLPSGAQRSTQQRNDGLP